MTMRHQDLPVTLHNDKRGLLTIEDGHLDVLQLSRDGRPPKRLLTCEMRNFLRAALAGDGAHASESRRLELDTLIQKGSQLRISTMHVLVEPIHAPEAEKWVATAMTSAYEEIKPFRRVLVLVNPIGGKGKGRAVVRETVMPILEAAGCAIKIMETKHRSHAEEMAREVELEYDVIATASGDGLVYDVLNGLAARPDARKALRIAIAPIPTGSANALCTNLFGVKDTFNVPLACLNIIKGQHLPLDLCSVLLLPSLTRRWSFLSQALGLMVDLDIGTESMRWMGDARFMLGFIKGLAANRNFSCRLRMKVVESDKVEMARAAREIVGNARGKKVLGQGTDPLVNGVKKVDLNGSSNEESSSSTAAHEIPAANGTHSTKGSGNMNGQAEESQGALPDAKPLEPDESWTTIESTGKKPAVKLQSPTEAMNSGTPGGWIDGEGMLYAYAGTMPWAARDLMQWPVASSGHGVVDIVVQSIVPRATMVNAITGAEKGDAYWMQCQHYYKVSAFTGENLDRQRQPIFTIDGEAFPFESFHVEVHPGLANILSLDGHFFISEFLRKHHGLE